MSKRRIKKALWGLLFNSSPLTSSNPMYSAYQEPNFNNAFQFLLKLQEFLLDPSIQLKWDLLGREFDREKFGMGLNLSLLENPIAKQLGGLWAYEYLNKLNKPLFSKNPDFLDETSIKSKSSTGKITGTDIAMIGGAVADIASSFLPEKTEYAGDNGGITQTMDSIYDGISDAAMSFGPVGAAVGGIMKGGKFVGGILNKVGGGTDGKTTLDSILGSSFLSLPVGLINGFGGLRTGTITKNDLAFELVGASYTGTERSVNDAVEDSGKKYGLFSGGARKEANEKILEARRQQGIIENIADNATDRFSIRNSMAAINGNRRRFDMQGGYNQSAVRVGRLGMLLQDLQRAKRITSSMKYQKGGKVIDPFEAYLLTLPENQRDDSNFRVRDYWDFNGRPKDFDEAILKGMFTQFEDGWHAGSVAENPKTGEIEFMKSSSHPSILLELDWYNSDDASEFRNLYELLKTEPYFKYVKRKGTDSPQSFKGGGSLSSWLVEVSTNELPIEFRGIDLEEVDLDNILPEFKAGGKFNLIPEGALHARKHNMDVEGITSKGIPVVSHSEEGKIELQCEIEREEIIFRLEVTKKLEELAKDGSDEAAIEAGKLLVNEILYNTVDNTNSLI